MNATVMNPKASAMANDRVVEAVNFLIEATNYSALIGEMTRIIENWADHPMRYGGHLSCLNAMLDVGVQSREAFERLVELIEAKRKLHPRVRRADYQRNLMRERRAREAMALNLHEAKFGVLRGAARMHELHAIRQRWAAAKRAYLASKGPLGWAERNEATREFWADIDRQLELNLKNAQRVPACA